MLFLTGSVRLAADAVLRVGDNGNQWMNFTGLANVRGQDAPVQVDCSWSGDHSNVAPFMPKGREIEIAGEVIPGGYWSKARGVQVYTLRVQISALTLLGANPNRAPEAATTVAESISDIPFE